MKELCEARVKPEMSSNLADEPSLANVLPSHTKLPVKRVNSLQIYTVNETPFKQSTCKKIPMNFIVTGHRSRLTGRWTPHSKLPVKGVNSLLIYVVSETPFETVNL